MCAHNPHTKSQQKLSTHTLAGKYAHTLTQQCDAHANRYTCECPGTNVFKVFMRNTDTFAQTHFSLAVIWCVCLRSWKHVFFCVCVCVCLCVCEEALWRDPREDLDESVADRRDSEHPSTHR